MRRESNAGFDEKTRKMLQIARPYGKRASVPATASTAASEPASLPMLAPGSSAWQVKSNLKAPHRISRLTNGRRPIKSAA